jgi:hypothetical protein
MRSNRRLGANSTAGGHEIESGRPDLGHAACQSSLQCERNGSLSAGRGTERYIDLRGLAVADHGKGYLVARLVPFDHLR